MARARGAGGIGMRLLVAASAVVLVLAACGVDADVAGDPPAATAATTTSTTHRPGSTTTAGPEETAIVIGPVKASEDGSGTVTFTFDVEVDVVEPPDSLRCELSLAGSVLSAAGARVDEASSRWAFDFDFAKAPWDLFDATLDLPGVEITCAISGVFEREIVDIVTGEVADAEFSDPPNDRQVLEPGAPAVSIDAIEVPDAGGADAVREAALDVVVGGAAEGDELACVVTDPAPPERDLDQARAELSGEPEETVDLRLELGPQSAVAAAPYLIYFCQVGDTIAVETVVPPT